MKLEDVKKNLNKIVRYKDSTGIYRLTGCILRKKGTRYYHQAELTDEKHGKSLIICKLDEVGAIE